MTGKSPPFSLASTLAFLAGLGLTLMVVSAALGVIGSAGGTSLGVLFAAGTAIFVSGIIAWFASKRPDTQFDDINEPRYHGHDDH